MTLSIAGASLKKPSALPGFAPALGFTLIYLTLIVLLPLAALILKASSLGFAGLWAVAMEPRVLAALKTTFGVSFAAALIDVVFGAIVAWTLTRYRFPGRRLVDALVDLPFALPTAVAGLALAALYAPNGWLGAPLAAIGVKIAFTRWGILVALTFVGLPFVVRTVQPLIEELDKELEEASATLGASRLRTLLRVALPPLVPALLAGLALAFARGVGEYGSVIFIAGNIAYVSEIAPLLVVIKLEEYDYTGATGVAAIMLAVSFVMLLTINLLHAWSRRRLGDV
jgi:sulfate transport system permease protein